MRITTLPPDNDKSSSLTAAVRQLAASSSSGAHLAPHKTGSDWSEHAKLIQSEALSSPLTRKIARSEKLVPPLPHPLRY